MTTGDHSPLQRELGFTGTQRKTKRQTTMDAKIGNKILVRLSPSTLRLSSYHVTTIVPAFGVTCEVTKIL